MLLVHPVQEVVRGLPALVPFLIAGASAGSVWPVLAGLVIAVGLGASRWFTTRFRVTDGQVQLRRGLFSRRTVAAPLDRVRTVDVEANLMHRGLGLVRLRVGTGHADTKRSKDLTLDGLTRSEGLRLRDELLHRQPAAGTPVAGAGWAPNRSGAWPERSDPGSGIGATGTRVRIVRLDPRWLRYGPFSLTGLVTAAAGLGLGWRVVGEAHLHPAGIGIVRSGRAAVQSDPAWLIAILVAVGVAAVVGALSTVRYVLAYWGFALERTGAGTLHVTRGLLTTRATTLAEHRVRGVAVKEPLLLRAVGGAQVTAVASGLRAGRGADTAGAALLLPPAPRRVALEVARVVLRRAGPVDCGLIPHGPAARRRRYLRALAPGVVLVVAATVGVALSAPPWLLIAPALTVPAGLWLAHDRGRSLGHADVDGYVVTGEGSLVRRRVALAHDAVIGWNVRTTLFQRRSGLVTLTATTACGTRRYRILDVSGAVAEQFADQVTPGLLTPFLA